MSGRRRLHGRLFISPCVDVRGAPSPTLVRCRRDGPDPGGGSACAAASCLPRLRQHHSRHRCRFVRQWPAVTGSLAAPSPRFLGFVPRQRLHTLRLLPACQPCDVGASRAGAALRHGRVPRRLGAAGSGAGLLHAAHQPPCAAAAWSRGLGAAAALPPGRDASCHRSAAPTWRCGAGSAAGVPRLGN